VERMAKPSEDDLWIPGDDFEFVGCNWLLFFYFWFYQTYVLRQIVHRQGLYPCPWVVSKLHCVNQKVFRTRSPSQLLYQITKNAVSHTSHVADSGCTRNFFFNI
jgi:hypothetical protein